MLIVVGIHIASITYVRVCVYVFVTTERMYVSFLSVIFPEPVIFNGCLREFISFCHYTSMSLKLVIPI